MLSYDFRTYIAEGTEFYGMSIKNLDALEYHERKAPFPSSLLSFLDLDVAALAPLLKKISDELWSLTLTQDKRFAQEALSELAELEERHIYFSHLRLDWTWRIGQALALGNFSENLLHRSVLLRMAENLKQMQEQIRELFANVLDCHSHGGLRRRPLPDDRRVRHRQDGVFSYTPILSTPAPAA